MTATISHLPVGRHTETSVVRKLPFYQISPIFKKILGEWSKVQNDRLLAILSNTSVCPPQSIIFDVLSADVIHPSIINTTAKEIVSRGITILENADHPTSITVTGTKLNDDRYNAILMPIKKSPRGTIIIVIEGSCDV